MSKHARITLAERLRRLRDRATASSQTPPNATAYTTRQQPERASGVYPVVKPQRAWLTMRRRNGNADAS